MNSTFEERKQKSYMVMRMTYDLVMALLFLGMAVVMLFAGPLKLEQFTENMDTTLRYMFGGMCLVYGVYRLYRGIKRKG